MADAGSIAFFYFFGSLFAALYVLHGLSGYMKAPAAGLAFWLSYMGFATLLQDGRPILECVVIQTLFILLAACSYGLRG